MTEKHPAGCSCGSPDCPEWQADHLSDGMYSLPKGHGHCIYCGVTLGSEAEEAPPSMNDDEGWEALTSNHKPD